MDFEHFLRSVRNVWDRLQALGATCGASGPRQEDLGLANIFVLHPLDAEQPEAVRATKLGARLLHDGRVEDSIRELHEARQLAPLSAVACGNLGCAYEAKNDDRAALYWYREAYRLRPQDETATCALALLEQRRGQADEAQRLLVEFLQLEPDHVGALRLLGRLHQRRCHWSKAAGCFHRLIAVDPSNEDWTAQLQVCLDQLEMKDDLGQGHTFSFDATEALHAKPRVRGRHLRREGEQLSATSTTCSSWVGSKHAAGSRLRDGGLSEARRELRQGRPEVAVEIFQQLLSQEPRHREALLGLAECQQELGNVGEALTAMKQLLSAKSDDLEANLCVAELLLEQNKENEVETYLRLGRLGRRGASAALQQRLLCAEARLALNKEDLTRALSLASEAVRFDASSSRALLLLATARHRVADYAAALRAANAALEPGNEELPSRRFQAQVHTLAAQAHERLREYPEAMARAERALQLLPGLVAARLARALALQQSGRVREAEEELMSVLQSHPQHGQARLQLAYCQLLGSAAARAATILEGLLASKAPLPRSQLGCAKVYLALALAQQRSQRAISLAKEALALHRNLQSVWQQLRPSQPDAVQRLRGICDLDLTLSQASELLKLLSGDQPQLRGRESRVSSMPGTPARGATPTARSRDTSQERGLTIGWSELIRPEELMLGPQLGAGGSAQVFRGSWKGQEVAVKRISGLAHLESMKKEVDALRRLRHPRLVRFIGATLQPPLLLVVTEFMAGGSLHDRLFGAKAQFLAAPARRLIACHTAEGLAFLHSHRVVHRDLKSMNILLDAQQHAKICDFGLAHQMCIESTHIARKLDGEGGSPRYMAPECYDAGVGKLTEKVDIWAAGCILIELFGGILPYADCQTMPQLTARILVEKRPPDVPPQTPPQVLALIRRCVMFDPAWRLTALELQSELGRLR